MPLPLRWSLVPVYGTYTRLDGTPAVGSVWFESASPVIVSGDDDAAQYVVPRKIEAVLDATGHFEVLLPSTNDPDINPKGWTYQVTESFSGGRKFSIDVPYANAPIDLVTWAQATPIPAPPLQYSYLTTADIGHNVASQTAMAAAQAQAQAAADASAEAVETANTAAAQVAGAVAAADAATETANTALANVSGAIEASNAATEASGQAVNTANAAAGVASEAATTANNAATDAAEALSTANGIDAKATQAQTDAAEALDTANGIAATANEALDTANTASTVAADANATAEAAETAAAAAQAVAGKWATPRAMSSTGPVHITAADVDGTEDIELETGIDDGALSIAKVDGLRAELDARSPVGAFKNKIINGDFDIWQRGVTSAASGAFRFLADRWLIAPITIAVSASQQLFPLGQSAVSNNPKYFLRTVTPLGSGADQYVQVLQRIEDVRTCAGEQVVVSFWAKADSPKNIGVAMTQSFGTGGSPPVFIAPEVVALTTEWTRFTFTRNMPSISGKTLGAEGTSNLTLSFFLSAGANYAGQSGGIGLQAGTFDIAQVQLEQGSVATEFERRPVGVELAMCQRYFEKSYDLGHAPGTLTSSGLTQTGMYGLANAINRAVTSVKYATCKRAAPAITLYSYLTGTAGKGVDIIAGADATSTVGNNGEHGFVWVATPNSASTQFNMAVHWTSDAEL